MPLIPLGLGDGLLQRVKERVKQELAPVVERVREEVGLEPKVRRPPSGPHEILVRVRQAVRQNPPRLVYALYQAKDADGPTWRYLACYSIRDRGMGGEPLLFAACSKENWKVEAFDLRRFKDLQVTDRPWPFPPAYAIEFRDA